MFESLTDKLSRTLRNLRGVGNSRRKSVSEALGEVRKALLSAGVHFRTAREFVDQVKEACLGQEVLKSVSPGQQVVKIIHDELIKLLGEGTTELREDRPLRVLMVGLHGAGKTTTKQNWPSGWPRMDAHPCSLPATSIVRPRSINLSFSRSKNNSLAILTGRTKTSRPLREPLGRNPKEWQRRRDFRHCGQAPNRRRTRP